MRRLLADRVIVAYYAVYTAIMGALAAAGAATVGPVVAAWVGGTWAATVTLWLYQDLRHG